MGNIKSAQSINNAAIETDIGSIAFSRLALFLENQRQPLYFRLKRRTCVSSVLLPENPYVADGPPRSPRLKPRGFQGLISGG